MKLINLSLEGLDATAITSEPIRKERSGRRILTCAFQRVGRRRLSGISAPTFRICCTGPETSLSSHTWPSCLSQWSSSSHAEGIGRTLACRHALQDFARVLPLGLASVRRSVVVIVHEQPSRSPCCGACSIPHMKIHFGVRIMLKPAAEALTLLNGGNGTLRTGPFGQVGQTQRQERLHSNSDVGLCKSTVHIRTQMLSIQENMLNPACSVLFTLRECDV